MVDSTIVQARPEAAGAKGGTPGQGLGRSRGAFTTKIHLLTIGRGLPMKAEITDGQVSDDRGYDAMMHNDLPQPKVARVLARGATPLDRCYRLVDVTDGVLPRKRTTI